MNFLIEIKQRLVHIVVSGTNLLNEDFRLKKSIEKLEIYSNENKILNKIYCELQKLYSDDIENKQSILLDILALIDAVLYTQADTDIKGDIVEVDNIYDVEYVNIEYSKINCLFSKSDRLYKIIDFIKSNTYALKDYRILNIFINKISDKNYEFSRLIYKLLLSLGNHNDFDIPYTKKCILKLPYVDENLIICILKNNFYNLDINTMVKRYKLISNIAKEKENNWYIEVLNYTNEFPKERKKLRIEVILSLRFDINNLDLLLNLFDTEKQKCKKAVSYSLASFNSPILKDFWCNRLKKYPNDIIYFIKSSENYISDILADILFDSLNKLITKFDDKKLINIKDINKVEELMNCIVEKTSKRMVIFWQFMLDNIDKIIYMKNKYSYTNSDYMHSLYRIIENFIESLLYMIVKDRNSIVLDFIYKNYKKFQANMDLSRVLFVADALTKKSNIFYENFHNEIYARLDPTYINKSYSFKSSLSIKTIYKYFFHKTPTPSNYAIMINKYFFYITKDNNDMYYVEIKHTYMDFETFEYEIVRSKLYDNLDLRWFENIKNANDEYLLYSILPKSEYENYANYFLETFIYRYSLRLTVQQYVDFFNQCNFKFENDFLLNCIKNKSCKKKYSDSRQVFKNLFDLLTLYYGVTKDIDEIEINSQIQKILEFYKKTQGEETAEIINNYVFNRFLTNRKEL